MSVLRARTLGAFVALACAAFGLFFWANPATSQSGPTDSCSGDTVATLVETGFENRVNRIYSFTTNQHVDTSFTVTVPPIAPGTYEVNGVSYDGYTVRADTQAQPAEIWFANLLDADGNVLATTGTSSDLLDNVSEITWAGPLGSVSWTGADAVGLEFVHASPGGNIPNSVSPSCVGFARDTPVQIQSVCALDPSLGADDPACCEAIDSDGDPSNNCPHPVEVLPEVVIAQVPDPIPVAPSFTG
jgi:hypothetical protein